MPLEIEKFEPIRVIPKESFTATIGDTKWEFKQYKERIVPKSVLVFLLERKKVLVYTENGEWKKG